MVDNVFNIANRVFKHEVNENSKINDFEQWESLGQLTLFMELEDELGIQFTHEEIIETSTMKGIISLIKNKKNTSSYVQK